MLKDTLADIAKGGTSRLCKLGEIYTSMDGETQSAFSLALRSEATTMDICRALKSEGISVGREFLATKRCCFKDNDPMCCINIKDGAKK